MKTDFRMKPVLRRSGAASSLASPSLRLLAFLGFWLTSSSAFAWAEPLLSPRNLESPFPYLVGGIREWPIVESTLPEGTRIDEVARDGDTVLTDEQLAARGLSVAVTANGWLQVTAKQDVTTCLSVEVVIKTPNGTEERQTLEVRPAPPDRRISYYADFGDDLIRIFMNTTSGQFSPVTKSGFDQYFRRSQAHGIRRLIVWLSPFPYIADAANYAPEDWQRYELQARAILDDESLTGVLNARTGFTSWSWLRYLLAARLNPDFGRMLGQSAMEHGIKLTVCYRPFEAALTKYYEVPVFDADGTYLWGFMPLASPTVNYNPDLTGWRHYRDVLREIGQADAAELATIELPGVTEATRFVEQPGIQIIASPTPPLSDDTFVLARESSGQFRLRAFSTVREAADSKRIRIEGVRVETSPGGLRLTGISLPPECRYLIISWTGDGAGPDLSALSPVVLRAKAGNRLGRETTYFVQGGMTDPSRVAGITANGVSSRSRTSTAA